MRVRSSITSGIAIGDACPLLVIAGPCVIETRDRLFEIAAHAQGVCSDLGVGYVFKASFDKANRTSLSSFRGPSMEEGLAMLAELRDELGVAVTTDVHDVSQVAPVAEIADVIQIPALLSRQTDLLLACAATGRTVNLKKGQFMAPWDVGPAVEKLRSGGADEVVLTERGTSFGYNNLVVDLRGLAVMRGFGCPVVFDATHAVQLPGGEGSRSGGERRYVRPLAAAAAAVGIDGIFLEVHPDPDSSPSDGPNMLPLSELKGVVEEVLAVRAAVGRP